MFDRRSPLTFSQPNRKVAGPASDDYTTLKLNTADARGEAKRLNELGFLLVEFDSSVIQRQRIYRLRCIGFAIDSEERDCLLFTGTYREGDPTNIVRCVPITKVRTVKARLR